MDSAAKTRTNPSGRPTRIPFDPGAVGGSVFQAFLDARSEFGGGTPALVDGDGPVKRTVLTYDGKGTARGDVEVPPKKDAKQVYYVRPVVTNGAGVTKWSGIAGGSPGLAEPW